MKRQLLIVAICSLPLLGCELEAKWKDLTGQNRPYSVVEADQASCRQAVGLSENPSGSEYQAAEPQLLDCMCEHGWQFIRQNMAANPPESPWNCRESFPADKPG
jgi:hypothetical protein